MSKVNNKKPSAVIASLHLVVEMDKHKNKKKKTMGERKMALNDDMRAINDPYCKVNSIRLINRRICRNQCKQYNKIKKECKRGYNYKPKTREK